jgi:hypothetical protein
MAVKAKICVVSSSSYHVGMTGGKKSEGADLNFIRSTSRFNEVHRLYQNLLLRNTDGHEPD